MDELEEKSGVLCDRELSASVKGKTYKSVRPAMLYGIETVAVTERQVGKMEVAELKMVRWALGVTRKDKIRNEYLEGLQKLQNWETNFGMQGYAGMDT